MSATIIQFKPKPQLYTFTYIGKMKGVTRISVFAETREEARALLANTAGLEVEDETV